jgi:hypothetical protein
VNDLVADIDRRAITLDRAFDDLDRPVDPCTKAARGGNEQAQRRKLPAWGGDRGALLEIRDVDGHVRVLSSQTGAGKTRRGPRRKSPKEKRGEKRPEKHPDPGSAIAQAPGAG